MALSSGHHWPDKKLTNGVYMPAIGLGTYQMKDPDLVFQTVDTALAAGYRMFDTAPVYGNEISLNKAFKELLPKYNLTRDEIFITSKLSNISEMGSAKKAVRAYNRSLLHLGVDYLDLYLIHYPGTSKLNSDDEKNKTIRQESWDALVQLYETGQVNAIGVSNFTSEHINDLLKEKHDDVIPAVNQVEFNPLCHDFDLVTYCQNHQITVQAYHSLGGVGGKVDLLNNPHVIEIAKEIDTTPAQVLLVWALQKDIAVIPKATTAAHIKNNINIDFKLTQEQIKILDTLDKQKKFAWDPSLVS